jgi:integrase
LVHPLGFSDLALHLLTERTTPRLRKRAGIDDGVARKKDGKLGRNVSRLSFHSLRHSFNSAMANADVPLEIRQKLTGHASKDMNKHYTHLELETVRRAVESIPQLPGKDPSHAVKGLDE